MVAKCNSQFLVDFCGNFYGEEGRGEERKRERDIDREREE